MLVTQLSLDGTQNEVHRIKSKKKQAASPVTVAGRFVLLGAGVQSSTLVEMIIEGEIDPVDAVIFADTGNEPPHVYAQVRYLSKRLASAGIPLEIVRKPNTKGITVDFMTSKGRFATMPLYTRDSVTGKRGILRRQCTNEYKIEPCTSFILDWLVERGYALVDSRGARRVKKGIGIEMLYGISLDEAHRQTKRGKTWQLADYPLIDQEITRGGCVQWLRSKGLPVPKKSSCIICPYHSDAMWLEMKSERPLEFEEACAFDEWLRGVEANTTSYKRGKIQDDCYLHPSLQPLRSIDFEELDRRRKMQSDMFAHELIDSCSTDGGFSCFS